MKKIIGIICIFILFFFVFYTGIFYGIYKQAKEKNYSGRNYDLYTVGKRNIPVDIIIDSFSKTQTIEKDEYGRVLFLYTTKSVYSKFENEKNTEIGAYVISQMTKDGFVYYYADICYWVLDEHGVITEQQTGILKEKNDWGKPLDISKMEKVKISDKYGVLDFYCIRPEINNERYYKELLKIDESSEVVVHRTGTDCDGIPVVLVLVYEGMHSDKKYSRGYVLLDSTYVEIKDRYNFQEEIQLLKNKTGDL